MRAIIVREGSNAGVWVERAPRTQREAEQLRSAVRVLHLDAGTPDKMLIADEKKWAALKMLVLAERARSVNLIPGCPTTPSESKPAYDFVCSDHPPPPGA